MATTSTNVTQISDDEIFRRKLLMDGEGMGDDRRLTILLKLFLKWSESKDETEEDIQLGYERLLTTLSACEFTMAKSQLIQEVNEAEIKNYEESYKKIESGIAEAQKRILERKIDLQRSKRVRKNKQQYDALAKIIAIQPDRKLSLKKLQEMDDEIQVLEKTKMDLRMKLEKRHKQFQVLLNSAYQLQHLIKGDEEDDDDSDADEEKMDVS